MNIVTKTNIREFPLVSRGKVRDIYEIDAETLLIVTTDRMSAFDVIMNEPIPYKGVVLNQITLYWMDAFKDLAAQRGIIIADTKFEFGLNEKDILLIDEVLTPDSSRFWPADKYVPGQAQPSFDKQFLRDWLSGTGWDKTPPPPTLPAEVIAETQKKYLEAYELLTGSPLQLP